MTIVETTLFPIILIPLIASILNGSLRLRSPYSGILATAACGSSFALALINFAKVAGGTVKLVDPGYIWFQVGHIQATMGFEVTPFMGVMLLVITGVGSLIHLYAVSYMSHDKSPWRFFAYLNLFITAMLVLALSSDLIGVFLGWEGVGVCSYLLIGYWYEDLGNAQAGIKAFITNRIGDLGFLISLFIAFAYFRTTSVTGILEWVSDPVRTLALPSWVLTTFALGIFWAACGKSAQIPLYVWLPDAMAGPTPVSALIHAATMVTSGILVFVRLWPVFVLEPQVLTCVFWIGMATAWLAALTAITQRDLKKILAYSTVSQLGFMFTALGAGAPVAAFFHVVTHACFKALLFLTAGSVIHGMHDHKDVYEMGGLRTRMPWSHWAYLVGCIAIAGFPLTSGFFSKDLILAKVFEARGLVAYLLLLGAALLTSFYMFRSYTLSFWGKPRTESAEHAHESDRVILIALGTLAVLSLVVGWLEIPKLWGSWQYFSHWVEATWNVAPAVAEGKEMGRALEWSLMGVAALGSLIAATFAFMKYRNGPSRENKNIFWQISNHKFYVDELYQNFIIEPFQKAGRWCSRMVDEYIINGSLHGLFGTYRISGQLTGILHTGALQTYALLMVLGFLVVWGLAHL